MTESIHIGYREVFTDNSPKGFKHSSLMYIRSDGSKEIISGFPESQEPEGKLRRLLRSSGRGLPKVPGSLANFSH
jgi:hypothetical protein